MEVLLLQDITRIGKKNDLIMVGDGFALNYLLPGRRAIVATPAVRRIYAEAIKKRQEEREHEKEIHAGVAAALLGKAIHFRKKATKTGKLYAAISEKAIADALRAEHQMDVTPDAISIPSPIKAIGTFEVEVKLRELTGKLSIVVEAEQTK